MVNDVVEAVKKEKYEIGQVATQTEAVIVDTESGQALSQLDVLLLILRKLG